MTERWDLTNKKQRSLGVGHTNSNAVWVQTIEVIQESVTGGDRVKRLLFSTLWATSSPGVNEELDPVPVILSLQVFKQFKFLSHTAFHKYYHDL